MDHQQNIIEQTKRWILEFVIGWNMCPFAKQVFESERIRFVASLTEDVEVLQGVLIEELRALNAADPEQIETTLLIHPFALTDFLAYNDFLNVVDATIVDQNLEGIVQIASFHPHYRFAGTDPDAVENFTNRSPYPMLHLLREASITQAVEDYPDIDKIPERNKQTMRQKGIPFTGDP